MSAPPGMLRRLALDWAFAVFMLVTLPVSTGAVFHNLYGTVPGLVMFAGMAGCGVFPVVARLHLTPEVRR